MLWECNSKSYSQGVYQQIFSLGSASFITGESISKYSSQEVYQQIQSQCVYQLILSLGSISANTIPGVCNVRQKIQSKLDDIFVTLPVRSVRMYVNMIVEIY